MAMLAQQRIELERLRDLELFHVRTCNTVNCRRCESWCKRNNCPICLDQLGDDLSEVSRCEGYPNDGCGCLFHAACVEEWMMHHVHCPNCRRAPPGAESEASESNAMSETQSESEEESLTSAEGDAVDVSGCLSDEHADAPSGASSDSGLSDDESSQSSSDEDGRDDQAEAAAEAEAAARAQQGAWCWQAVEPGSTYRSLAAAEEAEELTAAPPLGSPVRSAPHASSTCTAASTPEKERDAAGRLSPKAGGKRPACGGLELEDTAAGGRLPFLQRKAVRSTHR